MGRDLQLEERNTPEATVATRARLLRLRPESATSEEVLLTPRSQGRPLRSESPTITLGASEKLTVTADGTGRVGHAGSALLTGVADKVGVTRALCQAIASTRGRRSAHDPGVVLRDLAVMLAGGGECLADLGAQRGQGDLFGNVASDSTAFRVISSIDEQCLDRLRDGVAVARAGAWRIGARPERSLARWHGRCERTCSISMRR